MAIYEFNGAMIAPPGLAPPNGPAPGNPIPPGGDPVDLGTGLFVLRHTDLVLQDTLPVIFSRTYRQADSLSRAFGIGTSHSYDLFLVGTTFPYTYTDLILPDGGRIHYDRISPGTSYEDAVYEHISSPTYFFKSKITWNGNGYDIRLKNGTVYTFHEGFGASRPGQAGLLRIRDRYGNSTNITRDSAGNVTRIASPNGRWIELTNDTSNRITQARDNIGRVVTYTYDAAGRLWKVTDANNGITEFTYDTSHRMLTLKDAKGILFLTNEYDSGGRVMKQTLAGSNIYQFSYTLDVNGKIAQTEVTDPRQNVRRATFNSSGYCVTDTYAVGKPEQQIFSYEWPTGAGAPNLLQSITDGLGRRAAYTYDAMGNLLSTSQPAGTPDAVTYVATYEPNFNQLDSGTDPLGHTISFSYDSSGNLVGTANAVDTQNGKQVSYAYDGTGQLRSFTDQLGNTTQLEYDSGDLTLVTDQLGNSSKFFTDAAGRRISATTRSGRMTRFEYDALNRITRVTDPLGGQVLFGYDANNNMLALTDARNSVTSYTYDNMDQRISRRDPLMQNETYEYDPNGSPKRFTDRRGKVTSYSYDGLQRLTGITYEDLSTVTFNYDAGNRVTQVVDSVSGTTTRAYDSLDHLISEITPQGSVSYTYDAAGRRTSMTIAGQSTITYSYNDANHLTQITQASNTVSIGYDLAGRRSTLTLPNGVVVTYGYDNASQLTSITYKKGPALLGDLTYQYDKSGNPTQLGGSFARIALPAALPSASYDAANQITQWNTLTPSYDLNGNLTSDGTNNYVWNARNQLASTTPIAGPVITYQYDGTGKRIAVNINSQSTQFLYDGINPVQELSQGVATANLLTGLKPDEIFSRTDSGGVYALIADGLGSAMALLDSAGTLQTQYTYEPFGKTNTTGPTSTNRFQFTARENDGNGLYYYRARYYSPLFQRFISQDPIEFLGGDVNLYSYVGNRPSRYTDPQGQQQQLPPGWDPLGPNSPMRGPMGGLGGESGNVGEAAAGLPGAINDWINLHDPFGPRPIPFNPDPTPSLPCPPGQICLKRPPYCPDPKGCLPEPFLPPQPRPQPPGTPTPCDLLPNSPGCGLPPPLPPRTKS